MASLRPPFRILVLDSARTPADLFARLSGDLDADSGMLFKPAGQRPWIGHVNAQGMEIRRRTPFRNSFLPVVRARFEPHDGGTRVRVSMSLLLMTRLVLALWMLAATVSCAGLWSTGQAILLAVPAMLAAVIALGLFAFNLEADQAEAYLRQRIG